MTRRNRIHLTTMASFVRRIANIHFDCWFIAFAYGIILRCSAFVGVLYKRNTTEIGKNNQASSPDAFTIKIQENIH